MILNLSQDSLPPHQNQANTGPLFMAKHWVSFANELGRVTISRTPRADQRRNRAFALNADRNRL